ncbi:MAG: ATP-dependent RNA helicase DbpA [Burkholderiaceae bacterium]
MTRSEPLPTAVPVAGPSFDSLALSTAQRSDLAALGYLGMTPVQAASLPLALAGDDLIVQAQTGSGKTAAFALALLASLKLEGQTQPFAVQALVLCPTRELADQVTTEIRRLARSEDNVKTLTLCGGVPLRNQQASLAHGAHVVVGTPGRIIDHLERGALTLSALNTLVLDEADRMLDMGFLDDIAKIAKQCPKQRQTLLFSATYPDGIAQLAQQFMRAPKTVKVRSQVDAAQIEQRFYEVRDDERLHAVSLLLQHFRPVSTLAFCNTKQQCRDLADVLVAQGFSALALHGELEQRERDQVLVQFANRSCSVLVATDVAARGLDIAQLGAVINVDITPDPQLHVHRIGRTGRADATGLALSLASLDEMGSVGKIELVQGREVAWHPLAELTPAPGGALLPPMVTLQIVGGRKEKIRPGDVLGALTGEAGFQAGQIGKINVNEFSTYVAVDRQIAEQALQRLAAGKVKGKKVKVRFVQG